MNKNQSEIEAVYALSPMQQGIFFHSLQSPGAGLYIIQFVFRLTGELDVETFQQAWEAVCKRHSILRTAFTWKRVSKMLQVVFRRANLPVYLKDWRGHSDATQEKMFQEFLAHDQEQEFDFSSPPLLRLNLIRTSDEVYQFICSFHHVLLDGWAFVFLLQETAIYYQAFLNGQPARLPAARPYRDYIKWLESQDMAKAKAFWSETLNGITAPTSIPSQASGELSSHSESSLTISNDTSDALRKLSRIHQITLNTVMQGTWALLLSLYTGSDDVMFGATVSGRPAEIDGVESMVGLFINTLPVRISLDWSSSLVTWLKNIQAQQARAREYEYTPLVEIQGWTQVPRNLPLFETILVFENYPTNVLEESSQTNGPAKKASHLQMEIVSSNAKTNYPLGLTVHTKGNLVLQFNYDSSRYAPEIVERILGQMRTLLDSIAGKTEQRLSELQWLSEPERKQLLQEWNHTSVDYRQNQCIHELVAAQAIHKPSAIAVIAGDHQISYGELNDRANKLANYLCGRGMGPEQVVGICLERSIEMVMTLLAVLKSGAAYLPLDGAYPVERLTYMINDAGVKLVVTQESLRDVLGEYEEEVICVDTEWREIARQSGAPVERVVSGENLAYVIYTSGSTGKPKGVMVTHANLSRLFAITEKLFEFNSEDVWTLFHSYAFDFSVWEMWGALCYGGKLLVVPYWVSRTPEAFGELLFQEGVTVVNQTPSAFKQLMPVYKAQAWSAEPLLRYVIFGGEALDLQSLRDWVERQGDQKPQLINMYGITETTVHVTYKRLSRKDIESHKGSEIGVALGDLQAYVLDEQERVVPIGVGGELYVGGAGVARGYLSRGERTAERFVPNPFSEQAGERLYRTGDKVRWQSDGTLEFIGRIDSQVKIRGFRIELGEIESVLQNVMGVRQAVVIAREDEPGDHRLVAYVVGDNDLKSEDLRSALQSRLPEYMVPSAFVMLEKLPLTPNGKLDRKALPKPDMQANEGEYVAPRTAVEEIVAGLFCEVLKLEKASIEESFFELGGHSLLATQLVSRLRTTFEIELPLRVVFEWPTAAGLAQQIETARQNGQTFLAPPIERADRQQALPLSFAQQRLWFIDQLEPGSPAYNIPVAVKLQGELNEACLERSFQEIVNRHEVLRTRFVMQEGEPIQVIEPTYKLVLEVLDLSHLGESGREAVARVQASEEAVKPFDLSQGSLLRVRLLKLGTEEYILLVTMHHIISDGWSVGLFIKELSTLYEAYLDGKESPLPALELQYADFAVWQRRWLQGEVLEQQLSYWKKQLEGVQALELPSDYARPPVISYRGAIKHFAIPLDISNRLQEIGRKEGVTLYMTLLAAFQLLLSRYTEQEDVAVGTAIANRNHWATEPLIGFFVNQLVMRTKIAGNPRFTELLRRVREVTLSAYTHQDLPFEKLVEELAPERDTARTPLFQVFLALQNKSLEEPAPGKLRLSGFNLDQQQAKFDLTLIFDQQDSGVSGVVEYAQDLFEEETIDRLCHHLLAVFDRATASPQLPINEYHLLTKAEENQLLVSWNDTRREFPQNRCVHQLLQEQAYRTPDRIAIATEEEAVSYLELEARANQLAWHLSERGIGPEILVGVYLERSVELIVALLAILKAGGAYLPLDLNAPSQRLAFILEDTQTHLLITEQGLLTKLPDNRPETILLSKESLKGLEQKQQSFTVDIQANTLAYVMYTSGSTGQPKGVAVSHRNICRLVKAQNYVDISLEDKFLQLAPVSFDASTFEVWGCLLNGACLLLPPPHTPSLEELGEWIRNFRISILWLTAGLFHQMVENQLSSLRSVRQLLAGGEVISPTYLKMAIDELPSCKIINGYGPTENTTFTTFFPAINKNRIRETVPIGQPITNTQAYVLGQQGDLLSVGIWGELYTGGEGVARGYIGHPELSSERFVPDPFSRKPGSRMYKTGDRVRWRNDGNLEFHGRFDHQVKIRGYRIELGEIEATLCALSTVQQAIALVREYGADDKRIIAYIVAEEDVDIQQVRKYLQMKLPEYMLPSAIVTLSEFPLTQNGKINRQALPQAEHFSAEARSEPRTPTEEILLGIFRQVLKVDTVGIYDNFFEIGGHSLLATQITSRIRAALMIDLPLRILFESPSVVELSEHIDKLIGNAGLLNSPPIIRRERIRRIPLSYAQQRLWFVDQFNPGTAAYNVPIAVRFTGNLRLDVLQKTLNEIVRRHESLRTTFQAYDGQPYQEIAPAMQIDIPVIDLSNLSREMREQAAANLIAEAEELPFDLSVGPLLRMTLLRLDSEEFIFIMIMHHIISDAWSLGVLTREFDILYNAFSVGDHSTLAELELQYADFAMWQRDWLQGDVLEDHLDYWRQKLVGVPTLDLPTDYPRTANLSASGAAVPFHLSPELSAQVLSLSQREGVTMFMTLLAAFQLLLGRTASQHDVAVGTSIANRNRIETESLIGFFVNELVLRTNLQNVQDFRMLLQQVRKTVLDAYKYQDLPFERIVEELAPDRSLGRSPLFQVLFVVHNNPSTTFALPDLQMRAIPSQAVSSKFDLTLFMSDSGETLSGELHFNRELFEPVTIERFVNRFQGILQEVCVNPELPLSSITLATSVQAQELIAEFNSDFDFAET
jgi:amino acid adenylation domain-containing protein